MDQGVVKPPAIREMADPLPEHMAESVLTSVWMARELLSNVEHFARTNSLLKSTMHRATEEIQGAEDHLRSSLTFLRGPLGHQSNDSVVLTMQSAVACCEAARGHLRTVGAYYNIGSPSDFDRKQLSHFQKIWAQATKSAKLETHRALAGLAEKYPEAYDRIG